jgi:hypothetical protein
MDSYSMQDGGGSKVHSDIVWQGNLPLKHAQTIGLKSLTLLYESKQRSFSDQQFFWK